MLILASKSPRRQQILRDAGLSFGLRAAEIHEEREPEESATDYVKRLAEEKTLAVPLYGGEVILGADTVVVVEGQVLEKPHDDPHATQMLELLSGREHQVITGICMRSETRSIIDTATTRVHFVPLSKKDIAAYVASGEPVDKAGGYAIQGLASKFIDRIEGCYFNVVGLPVALVWSHLKEMGFDR